MVAVAVAVEFADALGGKLNPRVRGCPRGYVHLMVLVDALDLDCAPERRHGEGNVTVRVDVRALPSERVTPTDPERDENLLIPHRHPHRLAVLHTRRNGDRHRFPLYRLPLTCKIPIHFQSLFEAQKSSVNIPFLSFGQKKYLKKNSRQKNAEEKSHSHSNSIQANKIPTWNGKFMANNAKFYHS